MKNRACRYFRLADQYSETAKLLLSTMICSGNTNVGIDNDCLKALKKAKNAVIKSDMYLLIPAIFNCLQSTELFVKGVLLLNGVEFEGRHDIEVLLKEIRNIYTEQHAIFVSLNNFYTQQVGIIEEYKKTNKIKDIDVLYTSLRYPESRGGKKVNDYQPLFCSGNTGIGQFRILLEQLQSVKEEIHKEYSLNQHCTEPVKVDN